MRFLSDGQVAFGTWGTGVCLGASLLAKPANHPVPFGDALIYQRAENGQPCLAQWPGNHVINPAGASYLCAGTTVWGASLTPGGCRTNSGYAHSDEVIVHIASDDTLYTINHQQGQHITVRTPSGAPLLTKMTGLLKGTPEQRAAVRALPGQRFIWIEGDGKVRAHNLPTFMARDAHEPIAWASLAELNGTVYIMEQSERLTVRPIHLLTGWVISTGKTFSPDMRVVNGALCIGWGVDVGETQVMSGQVDLTAPDVILSEVPQPTPVPTPPPSEVPAQPIRAFPRKMFFCPFQSFNVRPDWGQTSDYIGNVVMPDKAFYGTVPWPLIQFLNEPSGGFDERYLNKTLYYFLHTGGPFQDNEALYREALTKPEKPIILYWDGREWPAERPDWIDVNRTFLAVQTYRGFNESVAQFLDTMSTLYARLENRWGLPLVMVPQFYDRISMPPSVVSENMPVYESLIRNFQVIGVMPFSDRRPGGMTTYPSVREEARRLFNAIGERPNRFDYWSPTSYQLAVRDKIQYSTTMLAPREVAYLRGLIDADLGRTP